MQTLQQKPIAQELGKFCAGLNQEWVEAFEIDLKLNLFALIYALTVPKKQREETVKAVDEAKKQLWKEAMKKAKGDKSKALTFFVSAYKI